MSTLLLTALAAALALTATIALVAVDQRQPGRGRRPAARGQLVKVLGPLEPTPTVADRLRAAVTTTALAALLGLILAVSLIVAAIALLVLVNQRLG